MLSSYAKEFQRIPSEPDKEIFNGAEISEDSENWAFAN